MNNNIKDLEEFKDFLECYFNVDRDSSELEDVILEFKQEELPEYSDKLLKEAKYIIKLNDWDYIDHIMRKHGLRKCDQESLIELVWTIIRVLSK